MDRSIDTFLKKGFDPDYAAYFASGRRSATAVKANSDFTLTITFDNGECRRFDMKPNLIPGTIFEHLMQLSRFQQVYLDEQHLICWDIDPSVDSRVHWQNKIDISPDCCYVEGEPIKEEASL